MFHTSGNSEALFANSTPRISTFFALSHFGLEGLESDHPLKPNPETIMEASEMDQMK
eukprot:Gb_16371 [translate_table: standard]